MRNDDWIDPRLEVRRSEVDGQGLFAREAIRAGETVMAWGGTPCTRAEAQANGMELGAAIAEDLYLPTPKGERGPADFMNHACDPNCWMRDEVTIEARRDIAAGEELTADYASWEADEKAILPWTCACGAPDCRRLITGRDWRLPELQASYGSHFSRFIVRRIEREGAAPRRPEAPLRLGQVRDDGPARDLFAERAGRTVGRVTLVVHPPSWAGIFDPIVVPGEAILEVANLLVREALSQARTRGAERLELVLEDFRLPYLEAIRPLVPGWGFAPWFSKRLYRRTAAGLTPVSAEPGPGLVFRTVTGPDDPELVAVMERILADPTAPTNASTGGNARELLAELVAYCRATGSEDWQLWELLDAGGTPVGAILPGFLNGERTNGGNLMIGVVPERRGAGFGRLLFRRGLASLAAAGAKELFGSTDVRNFPMIRLFEAHAYRLLGTQHYFEEIPVPVA